MLERRLSAEWALLLALVERNPDRLHHPVARDTRFFVTLIGPEVLTTHESAGPLIASHDIRIDYPVHFPAVPMELYLHTPVLHPNVHPDTGFVCLWDRHRMSNTVEQALHKTVAMLNGSLHNPDTLHVMQPAALPLLPGPGGVLLGVEYTQPWLDTATASPARESRLS